MTPTETVVARIYAEFLRVRHVERDDDLFGLGGDSMQAVRILLAIEERFGMIVPPEVLDINRDVGSMAAWIDAHRRSPPTTAGLPSAG